MANLFSMLNTAKKTVNNLKNSTVGKVASALYGVANPIYGGVKVGSALGQKVGQKVASDAAEYANMGKGDNSKTSYYEVPKATAEVAQVATPTAADVIDTYGGGGGSRVSSSVASSTPVVQEPQAIDLSDILANYTASAEAQKQTIADTIADTIKALQTSETSQRQSLTESLKRFQEDTATARAQQEASYEKARTQQETAYNKARKQQQDAFNANRADLEAQAFMANRAALQSAAARGLGGSGLQQLAQLQNLINQGAETSDLAKENTRVLTDLSDTNTRTLTNLSDENTKVLQQLATALARQEQDTTTGLNNLAQTVADKIASLNTSKANQLKEIDTNTASLKSQLQYQEAVRAENARQEAERFAAQMALQNASLARSSASEAQARQDELNSYLNGIELNYQNIADTIRDTYNQTYENTKGNETNKIKAATKAAQQVYSEGKSYLRDVAANSGGYIPVSTANTYVSQLDNLMSGYKTPATTKNTNNNVLSALMKALS